MLFNIAIDGPSAAGKSTIANILAKQLGFSHLDTGAMYRCVAYLAKEKKIDQNDEDQLAALIDTINISFDSSGNVFINDADVSNVIRENDISMMASNISTFAKVREKLVKLQQKIAAKQGYILDGRDIGGVVLPDARLKIYLIASAEARAQRRFKEYQKKGFQETYEKIFEDIQKRDYQDMHRSNSPLVKAKDAIEIDTSNMSIEEVIDYINHCIKDTLH